MRSAPDRAEIHYRLGALIERTRNWEEAAAHFRRATELDPTQDEWLDRLAWTLQKSGQHAESRSAYLAALDAGGDPSFLRQMLAMEHVDFVYRRRVGNLLYSAQAEIRGRASLIRTQTHPVFNDPVFMFWAQGVNAAPPVVRRCIAQAREVFGDRLRLITADTVPYYVQLSPCFSKVGDRDLAHFSDILRIALLCRYGGTWLDATCLLTTEAPRAIADVCVPGYFAFRYEGPRISSWFMVSSPGGYIVSMVLAGLEQFWNQNSKKQGYYLLHHVFEALYWIDADFAQAWDRTVVLSAHPPHALQRALARPSSSGLLDDLLRESFVHKLTYKTRGEAVGPGTLLGELVQGRSD